MSLRTLLLKDDWADLEVSFQTFVATTGSALTIRNYSTGEEAAKRLLGSLIVQNIPAPGIDEVFGSLLDAFEFHYHGLTQLPQPTQITQKAQGVATAVTDRAPMSIEG